MLDGLLVYTLLERPACCMCGELFEVRIGDVVTVMCKCKERVFVQRMWLDIERLSVVEQTLFLNGVAQTKGDLERVGEEIGDVSEHDRWEVLSWVRGLLFVKGL